MELAFQTEAEAREFLEACRWPDGPVCPHCGYKGKVWLVKKKNWHESGLYRCGKCKRRFTVTVKTVFHRHHHPLDKLLSLAYLVCFSPQKYSMIKIHRFLDIKYPAAWAFARRIKAAVKGTFWGRENQQMEATEMQRQAAFRSFLTFRQG